MSPVTGQTSAATPSAIRDDASTRINATMDVRRIRLRDRVQRQRDDGDRSNRVPEHGQQHAGSTGAHEGEHRCPPAHRHRRGGQDGQGGEKQPGSKGRRRFDGEIMEQARDRPDQEQGGNDDVDGRPLMGREALEEWWSRQVLRCCSRGHTNDATDPGGRVRPTRVASCRTPRCGRGAMRARVPTSEG